MCAYIFIMGFQGKIEYKTFQNLKKINVLMVNSMVFGVCVCVCLSMCFCMGVYEYGGSFSK